MRNSIAPAISAASTLPSTSVVWRRHLLRSYAIDALLPNLKITVENVFLGVDTAIPCGLIINELVCNSLKHAFPQEQKGEIQIDLRARTRQPLHPDRSR